MISKELLSAVLNCDITSVNIDSQFKNYIIVNKHRTMNIYELAHECKKWAWSEGYGLEELAFGVELYELIEGNVSNILKGFEKSKPYNVNLIFQACQWILNNKD